MRNGDLIGTPHLPLMSIEPTMISDQGMIRLIITPCLMHKSRNVQSLIHVWNGLFLSKNKTSVRCFDNFVSHLVFFDIIRCIYQRLQVIVQVRVF